MKHYKVIIAGSRDMEVSNDFLADILVGAGLTSTNVKEFISGGASGIDSCGERFARATNTPLKIFKANWGLHGRSAGPIRNKDMAEYGDVLLLIWDGKSRGSKSMKSIALKHDLIVIECTQVNSAVFETQVLNREEDLP